MSRPKVARRVKELVAENDAVSLHDVEERRRLVITGLIREAQTADTSSARLRALELLGKTADVFTTRVAQVKTKRSVDQIEAELAERLRKLVLLYD